MLDSFFYPESIAIIGASNNPAKLGYQVFSNLKTFEGEVYPVNIKRDKVQGFKAYKNLGKIRQKVDLAVITVPAKYVPETMRDIGEKGTKSALIISAGFKEVGKGKLNKEIYRIAKKYGVRVIGPNSVGIMNPSQNLNASFVIPAEDGNIALIFQSGGLGAASIYKTLTQNIGLSKFISIGNVIDVDYADLISYLDQDTHSKVILLYMEGISNGRRFLEAAKKCKKPIIGLKGGKGEFGSQAVSSHTGSLAGSYQVYRAAFKQSGIINATNFEELFAMSRAFLMPIPRGQRTAIITNSGGAGVLVSDKIDERGLKIAKFQQQTREKLKSILPDLAAITNPIDTLASARGKEFGKSLKVLLADKNVDIIIVACIVPCFGKITEEEHAREVANIAKGANKPVLTAWLEGEIAEKGRLILNEAGIPCYRTFDEVCSAAYALTKYKKQENK